MTTAVARVLRAFLPGDTPARYGYELMQLTAFGSGKLYPKFSPAWNGRAGSPMQQRTPGW